MGPSAVPILYVRELRSALRERSVVVNGILLPVFLYPALLWVMFSALGFVEGQSERTRSRVAVFDVPGPHAELLDSLRSHPGVELVDVPGPEEASRRLAEGELDLVARFQPAPDAEGPEGNFGIELSYDRATERSRQARARVAEQVDLYRERWIAREAEKLGVSRSEAEWFLIEPRSVSTGQQLGTLVLSEMLPLFLVIMVALGCFVPAIDTTAGERERATWETTLTLAAPRRDVVLAKYLYVATLGLIAGALNVGAMFLSIGPVLAPILERESVRFAFTLPWTAFPVLLVGAFTLALFFAAAMMILAAFARTFKEGQGMVTPVYWLAVVPLLLGQGSEVTLTPLTAAIPVGNVALMMRDAVRGVFQWALVAQTLAVSLAAVAVCLAIARSVLRFEDFLIGSYGGSLWRFLRQRAFRRASASTVSLP